MPRTFIHQKGSETIRMMPQNYLIARQLGGRWLLDLDGAIPHKLGHSILDVVRMHHCSRGDQLATALNADIDVFNS
jgi:hypothetical protein